MILIAILCIIMMITRSICIVNKAASSSTDTVKGKGMFQVCIRDARSHHDGHRFQTVMVKVSDTIDSFKTQLGLSYVFVP